MEIRTDLSIITLNVSGVNTSIKSHRVSRESSRSQIR